MYCIKKENNNNQRYFFDEKIKNRDLLKIKNNVITQREIKAPEADFRGLVESYCYKCL
jgi:hypothetical protein